MFYSKTKSKLPINKGTSERDNKVSIAGDSSKGDYVRCLVGTTCFLL